MPIVPLAMLAHTLASVMNLLGEASDGVFAPAIVAGMADTGVLVLLSMGGAQWVVLRRHAPRATRWGVANAVVWPLGVLLPIVTISLVPDSTSTVWFVAPGIGGVLMGLVVGALNGAAMVWLAEAGQCRAAICA